MQAGLPTSLIRAALAQVHHRSTGRAPAGLFFCRRLRSHAHMDPDLENIIRQALGDALTAGRDYQNLIIGSIGFAGVIFTLWFNSNEARKQRREERQHERETLRVALTEELKINRDSLKKNLDSLKQQPPKKEGGAYVPTDLMDDAYRSFVPKIGLLSQAEVSKVMGAYLSLRTYNAKLFLVGVPVPTSPRHVQVPAENLPLLAAMQEGLIDPIDQAIEVLKRACGTG